MQLTKKEILEFLSANKEFLQKKFGVTDISLFGSFARGEETEESDIDLLYEMTEPTFSKIVGLKHYLEDIFKREVGLVRKRPGLRPRFIKIISKELIHVH
ncbi:MAG: nucleotidyltransferase family protein [Ignavibacteriaceae bacterium]